MEFSFAKVLSHFSADMIIWVLAVRANDERGAVNPQSALWERGLFGTSFVMYLSHPNWFRSICRTRKERERQRLSVSGPSLVHEYSLLLLVIIAAIWAVLRNLPFWWETSHASLKACVCEYSMLVFFVGEWVQAHRVFCSLWMSLFWTIHKMDTNYTEITWFTSPY